MSFYGFIYTDEHNRYYARLISLSTFATVCLQKLTLTKCRILQEYSQFLAATVSLRESQDSITCMRTNIPKCSIFNIIVRLHIITQYNFVRIQSNQISPSFNNAQILPTLRSYHCIINSCFFSVKLQSLCKLTLTTILFSGKHMSSTQN